MKHCKRGWGIPAFTLIWFLAAQSCSQPVDDAPPVIGPDTQAGDIRGQVSVRIGRIGAIEALNPDFSALSGFTLDFSRDQGAGPSRQNIGRDETITAVLDAGVWTVTVSGFIQSGEGASADPVIQGSVQVAVQAGERKDLAVTVDKPAAGTVKQGALRGSIDFPWDLLDSAWFAFFKLEDDGKTRQDEPDKTVELFQRENGALKISLEPGRYHVELALQSGGAPERREERQVQIYPLLETPVPPYSFGKDDFPQTPNGGDELPQTPSGGDELPQTPSGGDELPQTPAVECAGVEGLKTYLDSQPVNTALNPYAVRVTNCDLSSKENTGNTLKTLCAALSRYVKLDLSKCSGDRYVNIAVSNNGPNRARIVSLTLPGTVLAIDASAFSGYEALSSVNAPKVQTIGVSAFKECAALQSVYMPELHTIESASGAGYGTFRDCAALAVIAAPRLRLIGDYAFYNCGSLTSLSFTEAESAGASAFRGAARLTRIELPKVNFIGNNCFTGCNALARLVLGGNPPALGGKTIVPADKPVEGILVPSNAVEAYQTTSLEYWTDTLKAKVKALGN
jgi:hypothetical protein